jgi:ferredoxin
VTADFWLEHGQKYHVRRISQEEALRVVEESHRRGEITTAWFKVATGGRTGVICNCCSCCCGALEGMRLAKQTKAGRDLTNIAPSGYLPVTDPRECSSCGRCVEVCMFDARSLDDDGSVRTDSRLCVGCGLCEEACESGAISLEIDESVGLPLDMDVVRRRLG